MTSPLRIAFYAALKPPDHPVASGDRAMARAIMSALERDGHEVILASRFRSWRRDPSDPPFSELQHEAVAATGEAVAALGDTPPDLMLTYHCYHKAPDWIGPAVADAFSVPYIVVEASRALKHQNDPWAEGFQVADRAFSRADFVAAMHEDDLEGLGPVVAAERLGLLPPFADLGRFADAIASRQPSDTPRLLAAGMMRPGDKEASYRMLAAALREIDDLDWTLTVIGDGAARADIEPLFDPERTRFLGAIEPEAMPSAYAEGDIFVWPGVREAYGMVYLEAQAAGLPVVGSRRGGIPELMIEGETGLLAEPDDVAGFADRIRALLDSPERVGEMGAAASAHVLRHHSLDTGRRALAGFIERVMVDEPRSASGG